MIRRMPALLLALVVAFGGVATMQAQATRLESGLLTVEDLPVGWSQRPASSESPRWTWCGVSLGAFEGANGWAGAAFRRGDDSITQQVRLFPTADRAREVFAAIRDTSAQPCTFQFPDGDRSIGVDAGPMSWSPLGDESFAIRADLSTATGIARADLVMQLWRQGPALVIVIVQWGYYFQSPADLEWARSLADLITARLDPAALLPPPAVREPR